jgi:hypothetical protein
MTTTKEPQMDSFTFVSPIAPTHITPEEIAGFVDSVAMPEPRLYQPMAWMQPDGAMIATEHIDLFTELGGPDWLAAAGFTLQPYGDPVWII